MFTTTDEFFNLMTGAVLLTTFTTAFWIKEYPKVFWASISPVLASVTLTVTVWIPVTERLNPSISATLFSIEIFVRSYVPSKAALSWITKLLIVSRGFKSCWLTSITGNVFSFSTVVTLLSSAYTVFVEYVPAMSNADNNPAPTLPSFLFNLFFTMILFYFFSC